MRIERILLVLAGTMLLAGLGVYFTELFVRSGYEHIEIRSFPDEVETTINGRSVGNITSIHLEPGTYTMQFEQDGFGSDYRYVTVTEDSDPSIFVELPAESDEAKQWAKDNQDKLDELNQLISKSAVASQDQLIDDQPIVEELPYRTSLFSIGYQRQTESDFVVTIDAPDVYVPYALTRIEQWGYNPAELPLVFTNQRNPFDE